MINIKLPSWTGWPHIVCDLIALRLWPGDTKNFNRSPLICLSSRIIIHDFSCYKVQILGTLLGSMILLAQSKSHICRFTVP
jgi:hypothetical protein